MATFTYSIGNSYGYDGIVPVSVHDQYGDFMFTVRVDSSVEFIESQVKKQCEWRQSEHKSDEELRVEAEKDKNERAIAR
jgi:hypothetical protein